VEKEKAKVEERIVESEQMVQLCKEEMKAETEKFKFELELKYQTQLQN